MSNDFMNEDQVTSKTTYYHFFKRLAPYAKKEWPLLALALVAVLLAAVASRSVPLLIGYAIDHGVMTKNAELFVQVAVIYLFAEIMRSTFNFTNAYLFQKFGNRMLFHLREALTRHVQNLPVQFFNKTPNGRIVTRLTNDVMSLSELFSDGVISVFTNAVLIGAVVITMGLISWKLTLATLFLAPLFIIASIYLSNKIRAILHESKKKLSTLNSYVAENLNGIKVVQLFNRTQKNQEHFDQISKEYRDLSMKSIRSYALMQPIMNLFNATTLTIALYYGGYLSSQNAIAIGALVAFLMNIQDFIPPLREILEKYQQFQNSLTSAERIFSLLDEKTEHDLTSGSALSKKLDIKIRGLNFKYEEHLPWVLQNINLDIPAGQSVALVGRTGSGKSTFISLLQKFYPAPEHSIFIGNEDLCKIPQQEIRRHIGVVQQDSFIFRGTIADNINLRDTTVSYEQTLEACKKSGYWNLLEKTGRNLESPVEERGANLSAGERQLISFARILAFDPEILILDEATANIDSESEIIIQNATAEVTKGRTSIVIAHRLSTIEKCDTIVVLAQGKIIEQGSHQELVNQRGTYAQLVSAGLKEETPVEDKLEPNSQGPQ